MITVEVAPGDQAMRALWNQLGQLADALPGGWVLVGGLMVQLHALEHQVAGVRVTKDIDLLGQARPPGTLRALDRGLREEKFELSGLDLDGYGYRYERDGIRPTHRRRSNQSLGAEVADQGRAAPEHRRA